jgi:subtilase family serine protease
MFNPRWSFALLIGTAGVGCATPGLTGDDTDSSTAPNLNGIVEAPSSPIRTTATSPACNGPGPIHCMTEVQVDAHNHFAATAAPAGYGPADLISAYNVDTKFAPDSLIAIVDAYDYPNAESDLAVYREQFNLPPCTVASGCLTRVNQDGQAAPLPGAQPPGDDWNLEASLDLQMASAMCPSCKIALVEAQDDVSDSLYLSNNGAVSLGAVVVSNSWGGIEDGTEGGLEHNFDHPHVGIFASAGDSGFDNFGEGPLYPSTSAHVTAVGGTTLIPVANSRGWEEKVWSFGGSGCSLTIKKPAFQNVNTTCTTRAAADMAAVADPDTGVAVFNANDGGWLVVGGTSVSSPLVASLFARYGIGDDALGYSYGNSQRFFDVHEGNNYTGGGSPGGSGGATNDCGIMCNAAVGWDGPTGFGTPNGQKLSHGDVATNAD